jgi:hypothetical protein
MIISRWILLIMTNVSDKSCRENQNINFVIKTFPPPPRKSCRLWQNIEEYGRARQATDDNIIRRMRFACWIATATDTNTKNMKYLLLFDGKNGYAKVRQRYVYTYSASLVMDPTLKGSLWKLLNCLMFCVKCHAKSENINWWHFQDYERKQFLVND